MVADVLTKPVTKSWQVYVFIFGVMGWKMCILGKCVNCMLLLSSRTNGGVDSVALERSDHYLVAWCICQVLVNKWLLASLLSECVCQSNTQKNDGCKSFSPLCFNWCSSLSYDGSVNKFCILIRRRLKELAIGLQYISWWCYRIKPTFCDGWILNNKLINTRMQMHTYKQTHTKVPFSARDWWQRGSVSMASAQVAESFSLQCMLLCRHTCVSVDGLVFFLYRVLNVIIFLKVSKLYFF